MFQRGETSGVFQFESAGIRNVLRRLGPENIEDIAAVNALYRPGPMQNIDTFIARKKEKKPFATPMIPDPDFEKHIRGDCLSGTNHADRLDYGWIYIRTVRYFEAGS